MKTNNGLFTYIKMRHSKNRTIPVILFLNEGEPRVSESTLKFCQMLLEQKKSDSLINQYIKVIAKLIEYKTLAYNPKKNNSGLRVAGISVNFTTRVLSVEGGEVRVNLTPAQVFEIRSIYDDRKILDIDGDIRIRGRNHSRRSTDIKLESYLVDFFEKLSKTT